MDPTLQSFFSDYMPHGHCYLWQPHLLWSNVLSDLVIAVAYFSIPAALAYITRKRRDLQFRGLFLLFSLFIILCGVTHLLSIYVVWHGHYGLLATFKVATAVVSMITAIKLFQILPKALDIPSQHQLIEAEVKADLEESRRVSLELSQQNEQIFRYATELSPIGLLIVDQQQIIRLANNNICKIMQVDPGSLEGQPLSQLLPSELHGKHRHWVEDYLDNPKQAHSMANGRVINAKTLNGEPLSLEINLSVANYHDTPHVFASVADVSARVKMQNKLAEKTDFLKKVLERSINGIYLFDLESQHNTYINEQYSQITGYSKADLEEIQNRDGSLISLFHPDDQQDVTEHFKRVAAAKGQTVSLRYRFRHKDGHWFWCHSSDCVYRHDAQGQALILLGTFIDISDVIAFKNQTEAVMREFKATFEQAAIGLAHVGLDGRWLKVNQMVCDIVGYEHDELIKLTFQDITHPDDLNNDLTFVGQVLVGVIDSYYMEKRYITKSGKITWVKLTVSLVHDNHGEPGYFIAAIECINEQKAMLEQVQNLNRNLAQSNQHLEQFAYAASHDLQEPLRKIVAFSDSLYQRLNTNLDGDSKFELERLKAASLRMRQLISDLLQLSRTFTAALNLQPYDINFLLQNAIEELDFKLNDCQCIVEIDIPSPLTVMADELLLQQALINVINNAIKYRHSDRQLKIQISARASGEYVNLIISDNGRGFDNAKKEYIFEAFGRLVSASQISGTGMGLAICQQIIQAHGGHIEAQGDINNGASFTLSIPSATPARLGNEH